VAPLFAALVEEPEDHIKSASAWSLGQIGRHTPDHAKVGQCRLTLLKPRRKRLELSVSN
jgi:hypothetical protein